MKGIFCLALSMLLLTSCQAEPVEEINIADSLKIRVQVLAEEYEGTGYLSYDESDPYGYGSWVLDSESGRELEPSEVFGFEELEVGVPRLCAPLGFRSKGYDGCPNLYIELICDDTVEVSVENAGRNQLQLYHGTLDSNGRYSQLVAEQSFTATGPTVLSALPMLDILKPGTWLGEAPVGNVHYINIRTSDDLGEPLISARLKITTVEDVGLPIGVDRGLDTDVYGKNAELTRLCEIELVGFSWSDKYDF